MWRTAALGRRSSCSVQGDGSTHALVTATRVGLGLRPCARVRSCARESGGRRGRRVCPAVPAASASLGPAAAVLGKGRSQPQKRRLLLSGPWAQASLATAAGAPEDSVPAGRSCDRSPRTPAPRGTWRSVVSPSRVRSPRAGFPPCAGRRSATVPRLPEPWRPEQARPRPGWFPGGRHLQPPRHRVPAPPGLLRLCLRMDPLVFKRSACRKSRRFVYPSSSCRWHFLLSHVTVNRCVRNPLPL